jgi:hypothetical protein
MALLDDLQEELAIYQVARAPQLEGLERLARLNLTPQLMEEVQLSISQFTRRMSLIVQAQAALDALEADGYPEVDIREILGVAFDDLQDVNADIEAATTLFRDGEAVHLALVAGGPEPK